MPRVPQQHADQYLKLLNAAMKEWALDTRPRQAAFLAQLAHESGELRYMEEIASGEAYEGRKDLGNTEPGDGKRYKGRGPIQLTGRANYRRAGQALAQDLEGMPELAVRPEIGFRIAGWFWKTRGLNELADKGDFREITRRINGGFRGLEDRQRYFERARQALGIKP
jgi:putative chitinase